MKKRKFRSALAFILSLAMVMTFSPASVWALGDPTGTGTEDDPIVYEVSTAQDMTDAAAAIRAADGGNYVISLQADISDCPGISLKNTTTILGNDHTITLKGQDCTVNGSARAVINLGSPDGTDKLTITRNATHDTPGAVKVNVYTTVNMYDGTSIKDVQNGNYFGAGVTITGGTFNMYGGTIKNCGVNGGSVCYGGGVSVANGGSFIMSGGTIEDCYLNQGYAFGGTTDLLYMSCAGAGVAVSDRSYFKMTGGEIKNNVINPPTNPSYKTYGIGAGVALVGGKTQSVDSRVDISGGKISGNEASTAGGGVAIVGMVPYALPIAAIIPEYSPANEKQGLFITGGEISGNKAKGMDAFGYGLGGGGGIFVYDLNYYANGAATVDNVKVEISDAVIKDNVSTKGVGGGIASFQIFSRTNSRIDIKDSEITGNSSVNDGGGICLYNATDTSGLTLNIENCTVTGNESSTYGGGLCNEGGQFFEKTVTTFSTAKPGIITGNTAGIGADDIYNYGTINNIPKEMFDKDGTKYAWYWDMENIDGETYEYPAGTQNDCERYNEAKRVAFTPVASDTDEIYLKSVANTHDVSFDLNYDDASAQAPEKQTVNDGDKATEPDTPEREGYTFDGWFTDEECTDEFDFDSEITEDVTLYAKWTINTFTVTFDANGHGTAPEEQTIDYKAKAEKPSDPTASGYKFDGWYLDAECTEPYDFDTEVTEDITLYAKWNKSNPPAPSEFTITYNSNGGTEYDKEKYKKGETVELDKVPVKDGYEFTGWYLDKECTKKVESIEVTKDVTVYAGWKKNGSNPVPTEPIPEVFINDHFSYVIGYPDGKVKPEGNITRAEVATIFFRLLKDEVRDKYISTENSFDDVASDAWYNKAVSTLANMGIIKGDNNGNFNPNSPITRAEFAAIAARFDDDKKTSSITFEDLEGHWAKEEVSISTENGWVTGYPDGTFKPDSNISRAEAMTLVNRVLHRIPETVEDLIPSMVKWSDNADANIWYYLAVQEATNSHNYELRETGYEKWTGLRENKDWTIYQ